MTSPIEGSDVWIITTVHRAGVIHLAVRLQTCLDARARSAAVERSSSPRELPAHRLASAMIGRFLADTALAALGGPEPAPLPAEAAVLVVRESTGGPGRA
uniref:Uncharacterized protein n=1 Tax=Neobacillus citreus TaxID=2833578 RepID=A0A942SWX4_9BACI